VADVALVPVVQDTVHVV
jgi:hypothetical protein